MNIGIARLKEEGEREIQRILNEYGAELDETAPVGADDPYDTLEHMDEGNEAGEVLVWTK